MIKPTQYTRSEGSSWIEWNMEQVTPQDLEQRGGNTVLIQGEEIHSLRFTKTLGGMPISNPYRWDCINGWTTFDPTGS